MRMILRIKRIAAMLLAFVMCCMVWIPAAAEVDSPVELMPFLGRPRDELSKAFGRCDGTVFSQHMSIWFDTVYGHATVERGTITGWADDYTFMIFLTTAEYCLDGYRVGESFDDARKRALAEGWTLVGEESGYYETKCVFEKAIGEAVYTLDIQSDNEKSAIEYITMSAVNAAQMEKALEEVAAYEAENLMAYGGYDEGFVFRNGVTWESTAEEIILSEEEEYGDLYEEGGSTEIIYSDASGMWYKPSLTYCFLLSDKVNLIEYRYRFGGTQDEYWPAMLTKMNGQFGESAELDKERLDRIYSLIRSDSTELYGNWFLEDGTYVALYADSWDLGILYLKEEEILLKIEAMMAMEE